MIRAYHIQGNHDITGTSFSANIFNNTFGNPAKWPAETRPDLISVPHHVRLLLDPFTLLFGLKYLNIKGTVNEEYKRSVVSSARQQEPTTAQIITAALAMKIRGDEAFHQAQYDRSLSLYQRAIEEVQVNQRPGIYTGTLNASESAGMNTENAVRLFIVRLQSNLAAALVKIGEYERAAQHAELSLESTIEDWDKGSNTPYESAMAYFWLGLANEGLGNVDEALVELEGAVHFCPENEEFVKEYERLETKIEKQKMDFQRYSLREYWYSRNSIGRGIGG